VKGKKVAFHSGYANILVNLMDNIRDRQKNSQQETKAEAASCNKKAEHFSPHEFPFFFMSDIS